MGGEARHDTRADSGTWPIVRGSWVGLLIDTGAIPRLRWIGGGFGCPTYRNRLLSRFMYFDELTFQAGLFC